MPLFLSGRSDEASLPSAVITRSSSSVPTSEGNAGGDSGSGERLIRDEGGGTSLDSHLPPPMVALAAEAGGKCVGDSPALSASLLPPVWRACAITASVT